jgi:predicted aspartyl protease
MKPLWLLAILWPGLCFQGSAAQTTTIPLELDPAGLMVHIQINGQDATVMVDTGSAITVLSDRLMKDRPQIRKMSINTPIGAVNAALKMADLSFGPLMVKGVNVLVVDMKPVSRRAGADIDGLLGLNVLTSQQGAFQIDLKARSLILGACGQEGREPALGAR